MLFGRFRAVRRSHQESATGHLHSSRRRKPILHQNCRLRSKGPSAQSTRPAPVKKKPAPVSHPCSIQRLERNHVQVTEVDDPALKLSDVGSWNPEGRVKEG